MKIKTVIWVILICAVVVGLSYLAKNGLHSLSIVILDPKGLIGIHQKELLTTAFFLMLIVVIPVFILTAFFAFYYRAKKDRKTYAPDFEHHHLLEALWWIIPCMIVTILACMTWKSSHELSPYKKIQGSCRPLIIQVIALEWKWLFIYPEYHIATIGQIFIPKDVPIEFQITADAPMNSFWIPQLGGQIYAMEKMKTQLHLIANEEGVFDGMSSNFSGKGFADMTFKVHAVSQQAFDAWVSHIDLSFPSLTLQEYEHIKQPSKGYPVTFYRLEEADLFNEVMMKSMQTKPVNVQEKESA